MDINSYQTFKVGKDSPFYLKPIIFFFDILPPPNTAMGIVAYTTVIYLISLIVRIICIKFGKKDYDVIQQEKKDFDRRIEEYRKIRSKEADKILKEITKHYK
jgi:hypothetical protein